MTLIKGSVGRPRWKVSASVALQQRSVGAGERRAERARARAPQALLTPQHAVLAETGDSWFNCLKLKLPDGCGCAAPWRSSALGELGLFTLGGADRGCGAAQVRVPVPVRLHRLEVRWGRHTLA